MSELLKVGPGGMQAAQPAPFAGEVHDLQVYLESHLDLIGPGTRLLAKQLDTGGEDRLDILAGEPVAGGRYRPVVVELKNETADENVLLQVLRYAQWVQSNPDSIRLHGERVGVQIDTAAVKVVIVAPEIERKTTELASFMRGNLEFEFIEVERFRLAQDDFVVVQRRGVGAAAKVRASAGQEEWNWERYEKELRIRPEVLQGARKMFERFQALTAEREWPLKPVFRKWYLPFQVEGRNRVIIQFPSTSSFALEIKLPDEPSKLGLPTWEAEGQKWDPEYHQTFFPLKTGEESLDRWMIYFERALQADL